MTPREHLEQAEIVLAGIRKLEFPADYLAIVDGATIAGYHLGNALLHRYDVLPVTIHANTPSKLETPISRLPAAIQPALLAFTELERLRFEFVRSPSRYDAALASVVQEHLETMQRANR